MNINVQWKMFLKEMMTNEYKKQAIYWSNIKKRLKVRKYVKEETHSCEIMGWGNKGEEIFANLVVLVFQKHLSKFLPLSDFQVQ